MVELQYFELLFIKTIRKGRIILGSEFSSSIHVFYGIVKHFYHIDHFYMFSRPQIPPKNKKKRQKWSFCASFW